MKDIINRYLVIDLWEVEKLWTDELIKNCICGTFDSDFNAMRCMRLPFFKSLTYEEAIMFRNLIKKIAKYEVGE